MEPSDSDFFETDSDEEFPRGDDLDLLDDDSEADEDRPQDKRIAELKEKVKGGDTNAVISYLRGKAGNNSSFFGKYTLSNENRLENLFWADETSRIDYECFGDVLTFDSTYNRNVYNKPLVIFSGSNHHG
ncbi:hypothetical protein Ahy_A07g033062 [Arachis hypogaea]|uniref:Uncharacterized protein n=1 Tax=Arachis hypogaea TaxID=3818 RepID=A0A445C887_ARAHY|nr:hypothetical protein Ahy_A07g033062 [Arachis hypogaea]